MAVLPDVFKAEDNRNSGNDVIPEGWYKCEVIKSMEKKTKTGDGKYILFVIRVVEGEYENATIFEMINTVNKSKDAVRIGKEKMASLLDACDIDQIEDTDELNNIDIMVKVGIQEATKQYPEKNKVMAFAKVGEEEVEDSPFS